MQSGTLTDLRVDGMEPRWGAYGPDGRTVAMVSADGEVRLWDVATAELLATQPGRGADNWGAIAFTADGDHIVVADTDGTVTELDAATLEPTGRRLHVGTEPHGLRTGVDGVFAVTLEGGDVGTGTEVVFADLDEGSVLHRLQSPTGLRANFSPDGRVYAYGGFDGTLGVVDVATGKPVESVDPVHHGPTAWVTFSPDSATLASMGFDGQLVLSDAATLIPLARMDVGPSNLDMRARYDEDGHTIVIAYEDGSVVSYDTDPAAWEQHACAVAGRNLTENEWHDAFGDRPYRETCPHIVKPRTTPNGNAAHHRRPVHRPRLRNYARFGLPCRTSSPLVSRRGGRATCEPMAPPYRGLGDPPGGHLTPSTSALTSAP